MTDSGTAQIEEVETTTVTPEVETPAEVTEVENAEELLKAQRAAQNAFDDKLKAAEDAYMEASLHVRDLQEQLKASKKVQKEALETVWDLKLEGPTIPTKLPSDEQKEFLLAGSSEQVENDTSWRDIPIEVVIEGIEGFGNKKREIMLETFSNLGELEDLRAKASLSHKPFKDLLPDGFGEGVASKIEDKIIDVMTKHSLMLAKQKQAIESGEQTGFSASMDDLVEDEFEDDSTTDDDGMEYEDIDDSPEESTTEENFENDDDLVEML